MEYILMQ